MIARPKTKAKVRPKAAKPVSKGKLAAARPKLKPAAKALNKKTVVKKAASNKKSVTEKKRPTKTKPAKSSPAKLNSIAKKLKKQSPLKEIAQKQARAQSKPVASKIAPKNKTTSTKLLLQKSSKTSLASKPAAQPVKPDIKAVAKPVGKLLNKPLTESPKKKLAIEPSKVVSKPTAPTKMVPKPSISAPAAKHPMVSKPVAAPRPIITGPPTNPKIVEKIRGLQETREQRKDLAQPPTSRPVLIPHNRAPEQPRDLEKDRLILMVRDPFWLHASWEITRKSVERAKAALAGQWHTARPVLRLLKADDNSTTSNTENVHRDIEIHGAVRHWYIETESTGSTFRLLLGYMFGNNRFHELARSNPVTPPIPGSPDATDDHWADITKDADRIYALSGGHEDDSSTGELQQMMQEKLKRPIGNPSLTQFGSGAEGSLRRMKNFHLELDAEMVVFGTTHPLAVLTVGGEPVQIRSDGSFSARVPFPNNRQVLAATSKSRDGLDEQTIVLAVERNTKIMEPLSSTEPDE
jgi:uncharacterized protein